MSVKNVTSYFSGGSEEARADSGTGMSISDQLKAALYKVEISSGQQKMSDIAASSGFAIGDVTTGYRAAQDLVASSYVKAGMEIPQFLTTPELAVAYQAFGLASGVYAMTGVVKFFDASLQVEQAKAIGDERGVLLGRVSQANNLVLSAGGASFGTFRGLAAAAAVYRYDVAKDAPTLMGRMTHGFMMAGLVCFGVFFMALTAITGWQIKKNNDFERDLAKATEMVDKIDFLKKQLQPDQGKMKSELVEKHKKALEGTIPEAELEQAASKAALKELVDEAYETGKTGLRKQMDALGLEKVPDERLKEMVDKIMSASMSGSSEAVGHKVEAALAQVALRQRAFKIEKTNEAQLKRIMGQAGVDAIKEVANTPSLAGRVRNGDLGALKESAELVDKVKKSVASHRSFLWKCMGGCILSLAAIALFMTPGGWGVIFVASILMLAAAGVMLYIDTTMYQDARKGRPGTWDKTQVKVSTGLALGSAALSFGLMASGVVSFGVVPAVVSAVMLAVWLGANAHAWNTINKNELDYRMHHPTLEFLKEALKDQEKPEAILAMLARLDPRQRKLIDEKMLNKSIALKAFFQRLETEKADEVLESLSLEQKAHLGEQLRGDLQKAAEGAIEEVQKMEAEQLEAFRKDFESFFNEETKPKGSSLMRNVGAGVAMLGLACLGAYSYL